MQKFMCGGYIPVMMATLITLVMYSWYNGRLIKQSHTLYDKVDSCYLDRIVRISNDVTIPKIATNLVYIVKSNRTDSMESKIGYSLFKRTPKRADNYWFVHIKHTDDLTSSTIRPPFWIRKRYSALTFLQDSNWASMPTNTSHTDYQQNGVTNWWIWVPDINQYRGCSDNRGDFLHGG